MTTQELADLISDLRFRVRDTFAENVYVPKEVLRNVADLIEKLAAPFGEIEITHLCRPQMYSEEHLMAMTGQDICEGCGEHLDMGPYGLPYQCSECNGGK